MAKPLATIHWLDDFGLNLRQLATLGSRPVEVTAHFRYLNESRLFPLAPAERINKLNQWFQASHTKALKHWPGEPPLIIGKAEQPRGLQGTIPAKAVPKLRRIPQIDHIFIEAITGLKRKRRLPTEGWFAVQARFASQVEGESSSRQLLEDRVVLVKALNATQAERKLQPEFKAYAKPYLNGAGQRVRWVYERTLDVYEVLDAEISPTGTEVFSVFRSRRLKSGQRRGTAKKR